jgi:hypothetical protein
VGVMVLLNVSFLGRQKRTSDFRFKKDTHVQNSVLSQPHGGRGGPFELDAVELIRRPTSSVALLPKRTRDRAAPTLAEQLAVERSRYAESLRGV